MSAPRRVVLVGGGHAHVHVLRRWGEEPPRGAQLVAVLDEAQALYSGMVPGWVAGEYALEELSIDVAALAARAGARVHLSAARRADAAGRRLHLADGSQVAWDLLSLDIGSRSAASHLPGAERHALATRPLRRLVEGLPGALEAVQRAGGGLVVVGGGAAGVELAFTCDARLAQAGVHGAVTLLEAGPELVPGQPRALARRLERSARDRSIALRCRAPVARVEADAVVLEDGERVPAAAVLWAPGAAAPPLPAASDLPRDAAGYLRVDATLRCVGLPHVLGAGDAVTLASRPDVPKAGVYAVRAGPVLEHNLRALVEGGAPQRFRPQRSALVLLNLGDGRALGARSGIAFGGRWARWLKDRLDRRFIARHRVEATGSPGGR